MKVYIGADHRGYELKGFLIRHLQQSRYEVEDVGDHKLDPSDDFPQFASKVATAVLGSEDPNAKGILLCGSGQGMAIAANRFKGIRACLAWDIKEAKSSRNDDDSNVLVLAADEVNEENARMLVDTWLTTPFSGATRYVRRINELEKLG